MKAYTKNCDGCGKTLSYSTQGNLNLSIRKKSKCMSCSQQGRIISVETRFRIGLKIKGRTLSKEHKEKIRKSKIGKNNPMYGKPSPFRGKHHTDENNLKNSLWHKNCVGKRHPMFGRHHGKETIQKMRIATSKRIKKFGIRSRNFSPVACKFITEYGKQVGYNFQHAMNGGEQIVGGYFVDGYDKDKNVVFEYDEPRHYYVNGNLKPKDIIRQMRIIQMLHPKKFIRYNEAKRKIYEV
jgi:hypothetical protein